LKRLARRAAIGIGRGGTPGGNSSGDIFLAFSTGNRLAMAHRAKPRFSIDIVNDEILDPVYLAAVEAVDEAILNALFAAETMGGTPADRYTVRALPIAETLAILARHGRLKA